MLALTRVAFAFALLTANGIPHPSDQKWARYIPEKPRNEIIKKALVEVFQAFPLAKGAFAKRQATRERPEVGPNSALRPKGDL